MAEHAIDILETKTFLIYIVPATNVPTDSIPNRALAQSEHELRAPLLVPDAGWLQTRSLATVVTRRTDQCTQSRRSIGFLDGRNCHLESEGDRGSTNSTDKRIVPGLSIMSPRQRNSSSLRWWNFCVRDRSPRTSLHKQLCSIRVYTSTAGEYYDVCRS